MTTYLITGCSRGLGLGLARILASSPDTELVFASARTDTSSELKSLISSSKGKVVYVKLDVTSAESAEAAATEVEKHLKGKGLDVIINNVGRMPWMTEPMNKMTDLEAVFRDNVVGAHVVTSAFLPLLRKGTQKKVANLSTTLGSMEMAPRYKVFPVPAYKVAKAALNMLTVQQALEYGEEGFTFLTLSPGWIQTDLGGPTADLTVEQGATAVLEAIHGKGKESNGKFFNVRVPGWEKNEGLNQYDGASPPW